MTDKKYFLYKDIECYTSDELANFKAYVTAINNIADNEDIESYLSIEKAVELEDLKTLLIEKFTNINNEIVIIGNIELYSGRYIKCKEINNINDMFILGYPSSSNEWFIDEYGNLKAINRHCGYISYFDYRIWKPKTPENIKYKILSGEFKPEDIYKYTSRLGDIIVDIFGWSIKGRKVKYY